MATVAVDLLRAAWFHRRISFVPFVVLIGLVAFVAFISFTAAPWVIYPGL